METLIANVLTLLQRKKSRSDPHSPVQCDSFWEEVIRHLNEVFPKNKQPEGEQQN